MLKVFPDAIGLGDQNREMLIRFGHAQFNMFGPKNEIYRQSMDEAAEVFEWVAVNCKREAVQPGGICMSMYEAADAGDVTPEEAEVLVRTLYSAGSDTTIYSLGNTLRALAEFPSQYQLLRSDIEEFAKRAFEEGIRYDNPARFTRRRATAEIDVDGVTLPANAKLLLLHMPAGRDPRRWENPGGLRHHARRRRQAPGARLRRARVRRRAGRPARGRLAPVGARPPRREHRDRRRADDHGQHGRPRA